MYTKHFAGGRDDEWTEHTRLHTATVLTTNDDELENILANCVSARVFVYRFVDVLCCSECETETQRSEGRGKRQWKQNTKKAEKDLTRI